MTEGLTTPPSRLAVTHLPLHRGGFGAVQPGKISLKNPVIVRWTVAADGSRSANRTIAKQLYEVLLRCPIKSSGLCFSSILSTAATRSGRYIRHRRRSHRSPFRCTPSCGRQENGLPRRCAPRNDILSCSPVQKSLIFLAFPPNPIRTEDTIILRTPVFGR